jgi:DNA polymerase-3 subunit epsilon
VRSSRLERKLVHGVLLLFLVPALAGGLILLALYRRGIFQDPFGLVITVAVGFAAMMTYLGVIAHTIGRSLVRTLQQIQLGTELMATVNFQHRLDVHTGDELEALAAEINRMADRVQEARTGLEAEVIRATHELTVERSKLSAVLETLGEAVVVTAPEGRVTLANREAQERLATGGASLLGRNLFEVVDREKVTYYQERLRTTGGSAERFRLHPGGEAVLDTVMTPFFDDERLVGFVLVLRDVTSPARLDEMRRRRLTDALRDFRGPLASIRSLSESLMADRADLGDPASRLVGAIHAEAVRLSGLLRAVTGPGSLGLGEPPWHFEEVTVADLTAMALRRLAQRDLPAGRVDSDQGPQPACPIRVEASQLSGAIAYLVTAVAARVGPDTAVWLRSTPRGGVVQIDVGSVGHGDVEELEAVLETPPGTGVTAVSVREIAQRHSGEVWAYADPPRLGFALSLPVSAAAEDPRHGQGRRLAFAGAGTVSAAGSGEGKAARPDFYDFSLLDDMERHLRPDDRARVLDQLDCVVLDTETTGLDPDRDHIVSLGAVRVRRGVVKRGETFDALVNPARPIPPGSSRFHGITDDMVANRPKIDVVLPAFLVFAEGAVLVGHQVWFDLRFLEREARRLGLPSLTASHPVLDTLSLSSVVHGPLPGHELDAAAGRLGVTVHGRHSALGDALATADVLVRLLPLLHKRQIATLGQALEATRRARPGPGRPARDQAEAAP